MNDYKKVNAYKISTWILLTAFMAFSLLWVISSYQYHIIRFQEEIQLFHTDFVYYRNYIQFPGGFISYLASYLTQFYHYPLLGASIFIFCTLILFVVIFQISKCYGDIYRFFVLPFLTPLLTLFIYNDANGVHFSLAYIFGLIIPLLTFWIYIKLNNKWRYIIGVLLYILVYFIAGGNALLLIFLMVINELFIRNRSCLFLMLLLGLSLLLPYIAYKFIYVTTLRSAYFSLTPFGLLLPNKLYSVLWLSIPIIYIVWLCISRIPFFFSLKKPAILLILYTSVLIAFSFLGIKSYTKTEQEQVAHIAYEVEKGNWDEVIKLSNEIKTEGNVMVTYFRNIALSEKGLLISDLLEYPQTGTYGLFDAWKLHYTTTLYIGELYYRMGVPTIAEQCAFEAMITSPNEYSSKALRRLVQTSMQRKDVESFEKYIRLFEKSPVYRKWAEQQREYLNACLADPNYRIPGLPQPIHYEDFFFYTGTQEQNLMKLIEYNKDNRKVFEYLSAFLLLRKNLFEFQTLLDTYYPNMHYTQLPRIFEEAVIVLIYNNREELAEKYDISQEALERFVIFNEDMSNAKSNSGFRSLKNKYKDSYWLYFKFAQPLMLEEASNISVY